MSGCCGGGTVRYQVLTVTGVSLGPFLTRGEALIVQGQNPGSSIIEVSP